jgi:hypothetical protein
MKTAQNEGLEKRGKGKGWGWMSLIKLAVLRLIFEGYISFVMA